MKETVDPSPFAFFRSISLQPPCSGKKPNDIWTVFSRKGLVFTLLLSLIYVLYSEGQGKYQSFPR